MVSNVIEVVNYVTAAPSSLLNLMIADMHGAPAVRPIGQATGTRPRPATRTTRPGEARPAALIGKPVKML
jgi:hypothetical protein